MSGRVYRTGENVRIQAVAAELRTRGGGTGHPAAPVRLVLLEKVRARSARVT